MGSKYSVQPGEIADFIMPVLLQIVNISSRLEDQFKEVPSLDKVKEVPLLDKVKEDIIKSIFILLWLVGFKMLFNVFYKKRDVFFSDRNLGYVSVGTFIGLLTNLMEYSLQVEYKKQLYENRFYVLLAFILFCVFFIFPIISVPVEHFTTGRYQYRTVTNGGIYSHDKKEQWNSFSDFPYIVRMSKNLFNKLPYLN